jgi:integrase
MSVRKRKWITSKGEAKEAWVVDYSHDNVRQIKTFERKKEADDFHATVRVDIRHGVHTSGKATVADAGKKWLADAEDRLEPATVESYRQHFEQHIVPFIGSVKLAQLTVPAVRAFMDRLRAEKRSAAMIKRVVSDLGAILADAQERGTVAQNVVRSLSRGKRGKRTEQRHKHKLKVGVDIPTPDEIRAILASLNGRWRPVILTAIFTGLRASELRGLTWENVDLKRGVLHVTQRADKFNTLGKPKSASGHRDVPMPPLLLNTLREWKLKCPKSESGLVFPSGAGEIEYHSNMVNRGLLPAQVAAGVVGKSGKAKYTGLHALRHFYASWCINRVEDGGLGLPIKVVQHRLGHASMTMTSDIYGHLFPSGDHGAELAQAERALLLG